MTTARSVGNRILALVRFLSSCALLAALAIALPGGAAMARDLTFEDRVEAQKTIERVFWSHRIWPKENPSPKPPLSAVFPEEAIRAKVEDYLRKSNVLATYWQRPITAEQLQAELDRMAKNTRDPEVLRELFDALGNDPFVVAETLARQSLADRLIRDWYAMDPRFRGDVKREAEAALVGSKGVTGMRTMGGDYVEQTVVLRHHDDEVSEREAEDHTVALGPEEWKDRMDDLARRFGTASDAIPLRRVSRLQEDPESFFVTAVY